VKLGAVLIAGLAPVLIAEGASKLIQEFVVERPLPAVIFPSGIVST
jgi:hypothetical protein